MHKQEIDFSDLINKPFKMAATGPEFYDCYNLCREVCRRAGIILPVNICVVDKVKRSLAINAGKYQYKKLRKPKPFCMVSFTIPPPYVTHMGIVLEDCRRFIHILRNCNVCIEYLERIYWRNLLDGYYEYIG